VKIVMCGKWWLPVLVAVAGATPRAARAMQADTLSSDSVRATHTRLFTRRDVWLAASVVATTAALMPADRGITEEFRDPWPQHNALLRGAANDFNFVGSPGVLVASVGLYGVGRLSHQRRWAMLGLYSTEAIAISGAATGLIKGVVGRARPYVNGDDADAFALGRGFRNGGDTSFPSGHATAAFAAATVVATEGQRWWPHAARFVTPAAYGTATLVALARLYSDKHWASDVVMGAGIGTLSGLAVVHFNEAHPNNPINRWLLGASVVPMYRGAMLMWTFRTRLPSDLSPTARVPRLVRDAARW